MRPLHLDITGLRSFRAKQTLDFTDLSLFAVIGDTGAGKSSILEAIVFALYNASTWDARGGGALMSQDADAMTVVFDFAVGGKRYRVNRTVFRNTRPALHALRSPDDPDYRFDGERVVTTEIRRLIGLDYDTFSKTVVLPQGRFAELLTARETDRVKVLTELLGLDEIDRLRDKLEPARQEADGHKRETLAARAALGGDPAAEAQRRVEAERAARASLAAVAAAREELRAKAAARSRVAERLSAFDAVERACAELVPAAQTIREVVPEHDRLQTELNALTEQRAQTRSELAAADRGLQELVKNRRDVASIVTFTGDVGRLRSELQFLASQALEFEERERALQAEEEALKSGREALKALQAKAAGAQSALAAAERHREEIRERGEGARDAWRSWAQASSALASARNALEANEGQRSESAARCAEFEAAEVAAAAAYESARIGCEQAERVDRAAALAHELHAGDPCPVCRRELPTEFVAPAAPDVAAAKRALQSAERARDKARREHEKSRAGLEALEVRRAECDTTLAAKLREHESAERALLAVGLAPTAEGEDEALAPLRAEFVAAVAAFHAAQEVRETERSAFDRADAELRARSKAQADAFKTHQTSVRARERRLEQTERLRQGLPEAYRPAAAAEEEAFARILGALEAARAAADEAAVKQKTLAANATDVERKLGAAQTAHQRTVSDVATSGRHALERALSAMGGALEVCELAAAPVRMGDDFAQLVSWCEPLLSWSQETRAVVVARRREMSAQGAALDAAIAAILLAQEVETTEA
ncbi:MAG: AAA family ATPase, partial [Vulcanimicrobiaceae bacterium]